MAAENLVRNLTETPIPVDPDLVDPTPGTTEYEAAEIRAEAVNHIGAMPWLPQGPDTWMRDIYDRVVVMERRLAAPNLQSAEYGPGTAEREDAVAESIGAGRYLFTAVHATRTKRRVTGELGFPDTGTAGLAAVLAEDHGRAFIMTGRQTGSAAMDPEHPIKDAVREHLAAATGFLDIHGCASHLFTDPKHPFNLHASIGLGIDASDQERELALDVQRFGRSLGLYVVIGNDQWYHSQLDDSTQLKRNVDGTAYTGQLAGAKPNMMVNYVRGLLRDLGRAAVPSLQMELAGLLRVTPEDASKKDERTKVVGVALGFALLDYIARLAPAAVAPTVPNEA